MHLRLLDSSTATTRGRNSTSSPAQRRVEALPAAASSSVRFWRPFPRKVADVICGEGKVLEVAPQAHEALQILLPTTWVEVVDGRGQSGLVGPGSIHLTSPLELHAIRRVGSAPMGLRVMLFAPAAPATIGRAPGTLALRGTQRIVNDADLHLELSALFDDLRRPLVALDRAERLVQCLARVLGEHRASASSEREGVVRRTCGVERACERLRAHVADAVSLDELAAVAGLSKFYLLRAFRRAYGLTPHAYQMQLRLARARRLIADGHALSYVTYESGFADQSHLTRRFAAFFGLTPARLARQLSTAEGHAPRSASAPSLAVTPPTAA